MPHQPTTATGGIRPGEEVQIDGTTLRVLAVGDVAGTNLRALGHISLTANGETVAPLPGDVCVEAVELPIPEPGSYLRIRAGAEPA